MSNAQDHEHAVAETSVMSAKVPFLLLRAKASTAFHSLAAFDCKVC